MGQRLGIAAALLGDPSTVILDEPGNGLDPEGILWIRNLLKRLAAEGKTVFLSSHLMSEMAQTAEHLVVVGRGRLIADTTVAEIVEHASREAMVVVHTSQTEELARALSGDGVTVEARLDGGLEVRGLSGPEIGAIALREQIVLHELTPQRASLEQAFMSLTGSSVEYRTGADVPGCRRRARGGGVSALAPADVAAPRRRHGARRHLSPRPALGVDQAVVAALDPLGAAGVVHRDGGAGSDHLRGADGPLGPSHAARSR